MLKNEIFNEYKKEGIISSNIYSHIYKAKNISNGNYLAINVMNKLKYKEFFNKEFNEEEVMKNTYIDNNLKIKKTLHTSNNNFNIIMDLYLTNLEDYLKMREDSFN